MAAPERTSADLSPALTANPSVPGVTERRGEYVVVARRYRPQTFDELIGQEHVARALKGAIAANRVGHAYLFTGARGVGKTSAARILAKALDCIHGPAEVPCNQCDMCLSISAGSDVDVLEIDGASNRGIDEIRQLRQNVNIRPSRARFKIYIIDEVHMLTREAFNALLKTLEEPPEHVKFIFCTTEASKIPVTILSRCQRFDFAGIQLPSIVERLSQIVAAEGVQAEPEALAILARRAGGSMRDSQSLLEQLLAVGAETITVGNVHSMLGTAGDARLSQLAGHLVNQDAAAALADLESALADGVDVGQLLEQLLGYFRDLMTAAVGCPASTLLHTSVGEHEQMAAAGRQLGLETILAILQIIDHTLSRLRYSTQTRTLAEMALVRIAHLENLDELSNVIAALQSGSPLSSGAASATSGGASHSMPARPTIGSPALEAKKKTELTAKSPRDDNSAANDALNEAASVEPALAEATSAAPSSESASAAYDGPRIELTAESANDVWQQALANLSGMLADNASFAHAVALRSPGRLAATFRAKYTSGKNYCERPDNLSRLENAISQVAGAATKVEFGVVADDPNAPAASRAAVPQRQRIAERADHPMIKRAQELFSARVVRMEDPGAGPNSR